MTLLVRIKMFDLRFKNPCSFIVAGVSQSGKTTFTLNLLRNIDTMFADPRCKQNVIYYYKKGQDVFNMFEKEKIVKKWVDHLPTEQMINEATMAYKGKGGSVLIIDDFGQELTRDIVSLFAVLSHHTNSVVILLMQNIFPKKPLFRDISLNSTYVVLFKNPRDKSQIANFARQFSPGKNSYIVDAFQEATKNPYSYLLFDFEQNTPDSVRVRSKILPHEGPMMVWLPK